MSMREIADRANEDILLGRHGTSPELGLAAAVTQGILSGAGGPAASAAANSASCSVCSEVPQQESSAASEDGAAPDQWVLCRLCEQMVPHSELTRHAALCVAVLRAGNDSAAAMKELRNLLTMLVDAQKQAMEALVSTAVQRYHEIASPLAALQKEGEWLLKLEGEEPPPATRVAQLVKLSRSLSSLQGRGGGAVFHSCASQLKTIIAHQITLVQSVLALDPNRTQSTSRPTPLVVGIGDFVLYRRLGSGGFAQVWLAMKKSTGDVYAIKAIRKATVKELNTEAAIDVENTILERHSCEFLVRGYFSFESAQHIYFALEFMPGGDLATMLACCGFLPESASRFYVCEVLAGVGYLHSQQLIHRDIKPSNVLVGANGHVKLTDFGLSSSEKRKKRSGTLPYTAPEVLRGENASKAVDFYSVGVLLFELLEGATPFAQHGNCDPDSPSSMLKAILNGKPDVERLPVLVRDLTVGLLCRQASERIDYEGVVRHPWMEGVKWEQLLEEVPPFIPTLEDAADASYFVSSRTASEEDVLGGGGLDELFGTSHASSSSRPGSRNSSRQTSSSWTNSNVSIDNLLGLTRCSETFDDGSFVSRPQSFVKRSSSSFRGDEGGGASSVLGAAGALGGGGGGGGAGPSVLAKAGADPIVK